MLYFSEDGKNDVVITQKDVREVQLAKAAISAGITIMMKEIGVTLDTLEKVSIAALSATISATPVQSISAFFLL